jgi:hypothetical protein
VAAPAAAARARVQPVAVAQALARPAVEAAADEQRAEVVAAPAAVAAAVVAAAVLAVPAVVVAAVALAVPAAEAAVVASAAELAARYSAAAGEPIARPAAFPRHLVDADRDVPRAAPAARPAVTPPAGLSMAPLPVLSWSAAAPNATRNPVVAAVAVVAALARQALAEIELAAAPATAQLQAPVRCLVRRAADAFLIGRARFSRVVAEQSPQRLAE